MVVAGKWPAADNANFWEFAMYRKFCAAGAVLTVALAGVALGQSPAPLTTQCGSSGQVCDRTIPVRPSGGIPADSPVTVRAPKTHCSTVRYTVKFYGGFASVSPGERRLQRTVVTRPLAPNEVETISGGDAASSLLISAEGFPGGCNTGRLGSWGVHLGWEQPAR